MNRSGNIFGGYLMRKCFELSRTCGYNFAPAGAWPVLLGNYTSNGGLLLAIRT